MNNPLRKRFSGPDADLHLGTARKLLGSLKNAMSLGELSTGRMKRTIEGVDYDVMSLFGMDQVSISVPDPKRQRTEKLMSETAPVRHEITHPGPEFDTIHVLYVDVFWFVSSLSANEDYNLNASEPMWHRMKNVIADAFDEAIAPLDLEDGLMTIVPRYTVISDRKKPDDGTFNIEGIYEVYPREQKTYAMGMSTEQFRELSEPHASAGEFGTGQWSTITMKNWWAEAPGQKLGEVQYTGVMLSEIAEQLMWLELEPPDAPPEILLVAKGMMTLPILPVILIDAGQGYTGDRNFATHYDDNGRVVDVFTKHKVISAWYNSFIRVSSDPRLPYDINGITPDLKPGMPSARFFPATIYQDSDGATLKPDDLQAAVTNASKWLAEAATSSEVILAERGYKDKFGMEHTAPLVDWNADDVRPFEAIPPLPFEE